MNPKYNRYNVPECFEYQEAIDYFKKRTCFNDSSVNYNEMKYEIELSEGFWELMVGQKGFNKERLLNVY